MHSLASKRHLGRFIRFCRVHGRVQQIHIQTVTLFLYHVLTFRGLSVRLSVCENVRRCGLKHNEVA